MRPRQLEPPPRTLVELTDRTRPFLGRMDRTLADVCACKDHPRQLIKRLRDDARWDTAIGGEPDMLLLDRWSRGHAEAHVYTQRHTRIAGHASGRPHHLPLTPRQQSGEMPTSIAPFIILPVDTSTSFSHKIAGGSNCLFKPQRTSATSAGGPYSHIARRT
jgi:hypothetical protein